MIIIRLLFNGSSKTLVLSSTAWTTIEPLHNWAPQGQSSYNLTSLKATTVRTLTRRTQLVCNSPDSLLDETDYKHNYNMGFVRWNTHSNTDSGTQRQLWPCYDTTMRLKLLHVHCCVYYNLTIYMLHTT